MLKASTCRYVLGNVTLTTVTSLRFDACIRHVFGRTNRTFEHCSHQILYPKFCLQALNRVAQLSGYFGKIKLHQGKDLIPLTRDKGGQEHGTILPVPQSARSPNILWVCFLSTTESATLGTEQSLHPWVRIPMDHPKGHPGATLLMVIAVRLWDLALVHLQHTCGYFTAIKSSLPIHTIPLYDLKENPLDLPGVGFF